MKMNRLIKSAMIVASVGAVLGFVGCSESPAEKADKQIAAFFELVTGCGGIIPQEVKDGLSEAPDEEKIEISENITKVFPRLEKYAALIKEANVLSKQLKEEPPISADDVLDTFGKLIEKGPDAVEAAIRELEEALDFGRKIAAERK